VQDYMTEHLQARLCGKSPMTLRECPPPNTEASRLPPYVQITSLADLYLIVQQVEFSFPDAALAVEDAQVTKEKQLRDSLEKLSIPLVSMTYFLEAALQS